jgi:transcriptional regulator with XRE-family HTH domain
MKLTPWAEIRKQYFTPEQLAEHDAVASKWAAQYESLKDLRRAFHKTQAEVARVLEADRSEVLRIERRTDVFVSTLREYVRALGGELEIHAVLPTGRVKLRAFDISRDDALVPILEGRLLADDEEEIDYLPSPAKPVRVPKRSARAAKR